MLASCTLAGKPALQEKALERFLSNLSEEARSAFTLSICDVLYGCDGNDWIWNNKLHTLNYFYDVKGFILLETSQKIRIKKNGEKKQNKNNKNTINKTNNNKQRTV